MLGALDRDVFCVVDVLLISSLLNVFYLLPVAVTAFFRTEETESDPGIKEAPWPCVVPLALTALGCFALFFFSDPRLRLAGLVPLSLLHSMTETTTNPKETKLWVCESGNGGLL